jgi:hypothetical protein
MKFPGMLVLVMATSGCGRDQNQKCDCKRNKILSGLHFETNIQSGHFFVSGFIASAFLS